MRIEQLGPPDAHHSTGLILHWRGRLLFALEPVSLWQENPTGTMTRFVGIGGHLEPGETWAKAVCREALEEADVRIALNVPDTTYLLLENGLVQDVTTSLVWPNPPRPLFVWSAHHGCPPQMPLTPFVAAVFEATLPESAQPRPAAEMPAILALSETQLCQATVQALTLDELLAGGARIWNSKAIPRSIRLHPAGSALWYVTLLDHLGLMPIPTSSLDGKETL